jgi:hypothetical protein
MSTVRVDEAELTREADAIAQEVGPVVDPVPPPDSQAEPAPQGPSPEEVKAGYKMIGVAVVNRAGAALAPNWHITPQETNNVAEAIAGAAMMWFPDAPIPPKYLALLVVLESVYAIVEARRDPSTGGLKPRRIDAPDASNSDNSDVTHAQRRPKAA